MANPSKSEDDTKPRIVHLRPRPVLPAEYRDLLREELEKIPNGVHTLLIRIEEVAQKLRAESEPIPIDVEKEDSLVTNVQEALQR
jgi:hypothetical protein